MKIQSIRWQLPISYAAIALLAALSLGAMLLFTLRRYYTALEKEYLMQNAGSVAMLVGRSLQEGDSQEEILARISSFSFLAQIHIDVFDAEGNLMGSTPAQDIVWVTLGNIDAVDAKADPVYYYGRDNEESFVIGRKPAESLMTTAPLVSDTDPLADPRTIEMIGADETNSNIITVISRAGKPPYVDESVVGTDTGNMYAITRSFYATGLNGETPDNGTRSDQSVTQTILDSSGSTLGSIQLSQGPAYGSYILRTVARGWLLAGALAVLLAGGVGFIVSRRITRPLGILGETTARMAQGELDMRANVQRQDEFGSLARSFNHMADRIQDTIQTLRRFVADAAHELQTPVTALHTDLELALQELEGGQKRRAAGVYLPRALTQVERLKNLSAGLLDLSRLEAGEKSTAFETIDLQQFLSGLSESWAARAEQAGIEFVLHNSPRAVPVSGSESQLGQALENLLDNAVKFTPAGGSIRVGLSHDGEFAEVQVQDSGIGIPAQDLPQLFSRFHRGSNSAAYPGNGLGLAIVRAIVEQHGGSVSCQAANPGPGTLFHLSLPLEK